ncbi:MAG: DUF3124 domain-containing protein [Bacteriovoracaceae bacterium]
MGQMASKDFVVPEMDLKARTGANFLVTWHGENKVSRPIIESVMLGEVGTQRYRLHLEVKRLRVTKNRHL